MLNSGDNKPNLSPQHLEAIDDLGDCIFDANHGELRSKKTNQYLHIEKKVSQVFHCLARAKGNIVTRDEIFDQVWPNQIVSDDSLNRCISVLRKRLKNFDHGLTIRTHPKIGFNLNYPVKCPLNANKYNSSEKDMTIPIHLTFSKTNNGNRSQSKKYFTIGIVLSLVISAYWLYSFSTNKDVVDQNSSLPMNNNRIAIMPFNISNDLKDKHSNLESKFRQLLTNHPEHVTIDKAELIPYSLYSSKDLGQHFNVRFLIRVDIYEEDRREILSWRIVEALSGDELSNRQINLLINSSETNIRILASNFVLVNSTLNFTDDKQQQIDYILNSAKYLYSPNNKLIHQHPVINMLAQTLTDIAPNSVPTLILLSKFLTMSQWTEKDRIHPYIDLAIETLNKAIVLAPNIIDSYQSLADIYLLRYQWEKAHNVLRAGEVAFIKEPLGEKISFINFEHSTGTLTLTSLQLKEQQRLNNPNNYQLGIELVLLYIELQQFDRALSIADSLPISIHAWGKVGAKLGPVYIKKGREHKGGAITMAGYLALGVEAHYSQMLIQGLRKPELLLQASESLFQAAKEGKIPLKPLLIMYKQLNNIDYYYQLAFDLVETHQFDIHSSYGINAKNIRQHTKFTDLMSKIGLIQYWNKYSSPTFCKQTSLSNCSNSL